MNEEKNEIMENEDVTYDLEPVETETEETGLSTAGTVLAVGGILTAAAGLAYGAKKLHDHRKKMKSYADAYLAEHPELAEKEEKPKKERKWPWKKDKTVPKGVDPDKVVDADYEPVSDKK